MAGHKAAVFDSAPRFWQGAPRSRPCLDKGLAGTNIYDQPTHDFADVRPRRFSGAGLI
jgi:hypothetical protein